MTAAILVQLSLLNAATVPVVNTNDSGTGPLRKAMMNAGSGDVLVVGQSLAGATVSLGDSLPIIQGFSIQGPTGGVTIKNRGFFAYSGAAQLSNMKVVDAVV